MAGGISVGRGPKQEATWTELLCCWSHHSPIHPAKAVVLQDRAIGKAAASWDTTIAMATCFSSKVAPQPIARGKTLLLEKQTVPGDDATSWGLTSPPLRCPQRTARDGKRKRCHFKDTVSESSRFIANILPESFKPGLPPEDGFLLLMSLVHYLETSDSSPRHRWDAGNTDNGQGMEQGTS